MSITIYALLILSRFKINYKISCEFIFFIIHLSFSTLLTYLIYKCIYR